MGTRALSRGKAHRITFNDFSMKQRHLSNYLIEKYQLSRMQIHNEPMCTHKCPLIETKYQKIRELIQKSNTQTRISSEKQMKKNRKLKQGYYTSKRIHFNFPGKRHKCSVQIWLSGTSVQQMSKGLQEQGMSLQSLWTRGQRADPKNSQKNISHHKQTCCANTES